MNIRPKIPIFADGNQLPSTVNWTDPNSTWYTRSGNGILNGTYNMLKSLHDKWKASGKDEDFQAFKRAVDNLNTTQREGYAPGHLKYESGGDQLFRGSNTAAWQNFVRNNYKFVNDAIGQDFEKKYSVTSQSPNSGDDPTKKWAVDDLWAGITDDRTTWGHLKNPNDPNYLEWKKKFNDIGIDYKVGPDEWRTGNVLYGFLKEPAEPQSYPLPKIEDPFKKGISITAKKKEGGYGFDWNKLKEGAQKVLSNPNLYATGRLVGNLINNERVYDEALKGIKPVLRQTYNTHRQVVGDEATKQAYYRRAAQGQTKAVQPFTSDADRQMAYQFEAKRVGDELRAQGDLADNQEIRRTSDESNQHQWNNAQRATEVANTNLASINQANALRHNLLAQKHSAQWSSIDNFLQGIEYRKRQQLAEDQALEDQLYMLDQDNFQYSPEYATAYKKYDDVIKKHTKTDGTYDKYDPEVVKARAEFYNFIRENKKKQLIDLQNYRRKRNVINFQKKGSKITYKKKDDLLYKSAKDTVEHFRKVSKISSDAQNRRNPKIEKLTSHPKGSTRKYQQGGVAPFTVYKPVALGGETTTSTQTDTTSTKSSKKDGSETLDMIKELFKQVVGKGLDSDVNSLYVSMQNFLSRAQAFGEEISTEDIASMYLQNMQKLNQIQNLKAYHDKSVENAFKNDAINEQAVRFDGALIGIKDGNLAYAKSLEDANEKGLQLLTNGQLMELRSKFPQFAQRTDLDDIIANGIGMSKIQEYIKNINPKLGTTELTQEGYTKVEAGKIQAGFELLQNAPDGHYKYTDYTKDQQEQMKLALRYISQALPKNMQAVIKLHADDRGVSPMDMIASLIGSGVSSETKRTYDAVTGKAAKDANGNSKSPGGDMIPAVAFFQGLGEKNTFVIQDKTSDVLKINTISAPITSKGSNTGSITLDELSRSDFGGQLNMNQATMGDSLLSDNGKNNIIIGDRIYQTELPIDQQAKAQGIIKPDLNFLKRIEEADQKLQQMGIDKKNPNNIDKINQVYKSCNLPIIYTKDGNGNPTLTGEYARFAMVNATATEDAFGDNPEFNDGITKASDKEKDQFELMMQSLTKNPKYKLSRGIMGGVFGGTDLYKGIIYIPMVTNTISALGGTGYKGTGSEYNEIEALQQQADNARQMGYNPKGGWN